MEQGADFQVFAGLGHHPLVGGHHQQHEVDAAHSGNHVLHEPLVARHIHDRQFLPAGQGQVGEAEFDGDTPLLLLLEPISIDAGEGTHQGRLTVVDVTRRAQNHPFLRTTCHGPVFLPVER